MDSQFIFRLKQPCKNRNIKFEDPKDGTVILNDVRFFTMKTAEDFIESFPRKDR